jgi:hypothetical protein
LIPKIALHLHKPEINVYLGGKNQVDIPEGGIHRMGDNPLVWGMPLVAADSLLEQADMRLVPADSLPEQVNMRLVPVDSLPEQVNMRLVPVDNLPEEDTLEAGSFAAGIRAAAQKHVSYLT